MAASLLAGGAQGGILFTNLFSFNGTNGSGPNCLVQGWDGSFYGTCERGGCCGDGTVFKMMPDGRLTTLVQFNGVTNGSWPCGLIQATNGAFYGTTYSGGTGMGGGSGTVFVMTPDGRLVTVVGFNGPNGAQPRATLTQGRDGYFYGTTSSGGANGFGTVFKMNSVGAFSTLFSFTG